MLAHDRKSAKKRDNCNKTEIIPLFSTIIWGCSSPGRALEWHSRGKGFDPPHLHQKTDTDVSVFIYDEGKHNFVVRNSVAVKPLRAGAHSPVQAHSFHYYGTCVPTPSPSPRNKTNTSACRLMLACEADIAACLWACPLQCGCVA